MIFSISQMFKRYSLNSQSKVKDRLSTMQIFLKTSLLLAVGLNLQSVSGFSPGLQRQPGKIVVSPNSPLLAKSHSFISNSKNQRPNAFALQSTTSSSSSSSNELVFDTEAFLKYTAAATVEMTCFATVFHLLDLLLAQLSLTNSIPTPVIGFLFYAISLKSRIFNPLNNQRPDRSKAIKSASSDDKSEGASPGFRDRVMPSWTPPGFIFPIMWLLIIGPIRAYSSSLIVEANAGIFCTPETMALIFHLTIGDIWNTINNTEKRYGAAVVGVLGVVLSAAYASLQYYHVLPLAGKLLGATLLWLVTASALITDTWRLNPNADGNRDPLYPAKDSDAEGSVTQFAWFNKEN